MTKNGSKTKQFISVDFDSRRIRAARVISPGRKPRMKRFHTADIPRDIDMSDPAAAGSVLARFLREGKLGGDPLIMNIPRDQVVLKPLDLPPGTSPGEIAGMVHYRIRDELPFPWEEATIDFCRESGRKGEEVNVLAAAARKKTVDYFLKLAEAADRSLLRLGFRSYANVCCLEAGIKDLEDGITALVNINAADTEIDVIDAGSLVFARTAIHESFTNGRPTEQELRERIESVVSEVARSLQGFAATREGTSLDRLFLSGSTGSEEIIAAALGRQLGIDCELFDPTESFGFKKVEAGAGYLSVIGQAIGSRDAGGLPFDFLNPKKPAKKGDPVRRRNTIISVAATVLALVTAVAGWLYLGGKNAELNRLVSKKNSLIKKQDSLKRLVKRVEAINEWQKEGIDWLEEFVKINALLPGPESVYAKRLDSGNGYMKLSLYTVDIDVFNEIMLTFQESGYDVEADNVNPGEDDPFGYRCSATMTIYLNGESAVELEQITIPPRPADDDSEKPLSAKKRRSRKERE